MFTSRLKASPPPLLSECPIAAVSNDSPSSSSGAAAAIVKDALEAGPAAGKGSSGLFYEDVAQIEDGPAVSIMLMSLPGAKLTPFELDREGMYGYPTGL